MSTERERELRDRLGGLLNTIEPGPAPVTAALRRGKGIRMRRWISAAAGLAVIAAGAVLLPGFFQGQTPVPATHLHYKVTVRPPGKNAPAGLIAYGTINGKRWRATAYGTGGSLGVTVTGMSSAGLGPAKPLPSRSAFVNFSGSGGKTGRVSTHYEVGIVNRSVRLITMTLANGTVLDLRPVVYHGTPLVAVVLPEGLGVVRAIAYSDTGEIAYAVPFEAGGLDLYHTWLPPGQPVPARSTIQVPAALHGTGRWSASVHIGPWGTCVVIEVPNGWSASCGTSPATTPPGLIPFVMGDGGGLPLVGFTRPDVAYLELAMKDGKALRVTVVHLDRTGYYAVGQTKDTAVAGWSAYNSAGHKLGGGPGIPGTAGSLGHG
jgi:hypothetical protein